jgi:hypothetical protein
MGQILKITGSANGTTYTGSFGSVYPLVDSQIYLSGSFGETRFVLDKDANFTDTGTNQTKNSFGRITVFGQGVVIIQTATT